MLEKKKIYLVLFSAILFCQFSSAAIIGAPGWVAFSGTLSDSNQTWASEQGPINYYSSAVLGYTFAAGEEFNVTASWGHDYRGVGMVYGTNVSHTNFGTYSADGYGPYFGAMNTTGFASNYASTNGANYYGQYMYDSSTAIRYFQWNRTGNVLSISYRDSLASSWTNVIAPITIASNQKVVIGVGEANPNETSPLKLLSFYSSTMNQVPEPGTLISFLIATLLGLGLHKKTRS